MLGFGLWVLGFWPWGLGLGFRVEGFGLALQVKGLGFWGLV